jgi:hypothetical protein
VHLGEESRAGFYERTRAPSARRCATLAELMRFSSDRADEASGCRRVDAATLPAATCVLIEAHDVGAVSDLLVHLLQWVGRSDVHPVGPRGGYVRIVNHNSGLCLDVNAWSAANGGKVQQWVCTGGNNQLWQRVTL